MNKSLDNKPLLDAMIYEYRKHNQGSVPPAILAGPDIINELLRKYIQETELHAAPPCKITYKGIRVYPTSGKGVLAIAYSVMEGLDGGGKKNA